MSREYQILIDEENLEIFKNMSEHPFSLFIGKGHSGFGLYISSTEYPEEGSCFIADLEVE